MSMNLIYENHHLLAAVGMLQYIPLINPTNQFIFDKMDIAARISDGLSVMYLP